MARISANIPDEDFDLLKRLAERLGVSMTDVLRRGIRDEKFFVDVRDSEGKVLIKDKDGSVNTLIEK